MARTAQKQCLYKTHSKGRYFLQLPPYMSRKTGMFYNCLILKSGSWFCSFRIPRVLNNGWMDE